MEVVKWIDPKLYETIRSLMPIPCVDLLVKDGKKILLAKRVNEPAKGLWWSPGGRILRGETLTDAVHRKAKQELGSDVWISKQVKTYDFIWRLVDGTTFHTPTTYYVVELKGHRLKLDPQHSEFKWFSAPAEINELHPSLRTAIQDSGILFGGDK